MSEVFIISTFINLYGGGYWFLTWIFSHSLHRTCLSKTVCVVCMFVNECMCVRDF